MAAGEIFRGDLNSGGTVISDDAIVALQITVGSHEHDSAAGMNGDDHVMSVDSLMIMQTAIGNMLS